MANKLDRMIESLTKLKDTKVNKSNIGDFVWSIENLTRQYFPDRDPLRHAILIFGGAVSTNESVGNEYYDSLSSRYNGRSTDMASDVRNAKDIIRKEIRRLKHLKRTPQ